MFVLRPPMPPPQSPLGTEQMIIIYWRQTIATLSIWNHNCMVLMMWSELGKNIRVVIAEIYENQQLRSLVFVNAEPISRSFILETISFISFILKYIRNKLIESINSLRSPLCPNEVYIAVVVGYHRTQLNLWHIVKMRRHKVSQLNAKRVRFDYAIDSTTYA